MALVLLHEKTATFVELTVETAMKEVSNSK